MAKLKSEIVKQIKSDQQLQGAIANATGKSVQSVERWARKKNHEKLTVLSALKAISNYTGNSVDSLIAA